MKRVLTPLAAACLLACLPPQANAAAYSGMVVFGDSLSDAGQRPSGVALPDVAVPVRYTNKVNGVYGKTAPMMINNALGFSPQVASTNAYNKAVGKADGNNWAVGGYTTAQILESITGTHVPDNITGGSGGSVVRQGIYDDDPLIRGRDGYLVSLQKAGKKIDPNTLFYINGGGNDFLQGTPDPVAASQAMGDSIRALKAAGGRYFMMPLLVTSDSPGMTSKLTELVNETITDSVEDAYVAGYRYQTGDTVTSRDDVISLLKLDPATLAAMNQDIADAIAANGEAGLAAAKQASKGLAEQYNLLLIDQAKNTGAQVIMLNVPLLYEEVLANPGLYGFDASLNLTGTCFDTQALTGPTGCADSQWADVGASPDATKLIYADSVHPTVAMQSILAGQALSVLSAPWQISLLPEMASGSLRFSQDAVRNQLNADWGQWQAIGQWRGFVTGGYSRQNFNRADFSAAGDGEGLGLNIGTSYRVDDQWRFGVALSLQDQELKAGERDSEFDLKSYIASGFTQYHNGLVWFDVGASVGHLDYSNIERRFAMGRVTRTENGSTDGNLWALSGRLGVELGVQDDALKISPFMSADYSRIDVDGYSEKGASSTALTYGDQVRTSQRLGLGVQARYQFGEHTSAFGEIAREKEFKDGGNDIDMRFNATYQGASLPGFTLQGYETEKSLTRFNLGVRHQFSQSLALQGAYNYLHGANDNQHGANLALVFDW